MTKSVHAQADKIIIQITDSHLMDQPEASFVKINPEMSFHAVIKDIVTRFPHIDAIVHTGDVAQVATSATYARYQAYMQSLGIPFYQVPGNHDDVNCFPFAAPDPMPAVLDFSPWRIILLNSTVQGRIDGWISSEQLQLLDQQLTQCPEQPVLLACHHHPLEMQSHWIDQHKLKNTPQFTEVLAKHQQVKAVICGHVHQDSLNLWQHIQFLSTPATSVQFKPKSHDFALDAQAPGYRCLYLKANGEFTTEVHRLNNFEQHINNDISGY